MIGMKVVQYKKENENGCNISFFHETAEDIWELADPETSNGSAIVAEDLYEICPHCQLPRENFEAECEVGPQDLCKCDLSYLEEQRDEEEHQAEYAARSDERGREEQEFEEALETALKEYVESYISVEPYSIETIIEGIRANSNEPVQQLTEDFDDDELETKIMEMVEAGKIECQWWSGAPEEWIRVNRNKPVLAGIDVCCIDHTEGIPTEDNPIGCKCLCCNPEPVLQKFKDFVATDTWEKNIRKLIEDDLPWKMNSYGREFVDLWHNKNYVEFELFDTKDEYTEDELRIIRRNADELNEWYEEELNRVDED